MGGALAVHTSLTEQVDGLIGLVVVDVVEGTAMDALSSMQGFLRGRPKTFPTLEYAIEWSLRSGQVRNTESARVSMAGQLKNSTTDKCAVLETSAIQKVRLSQVRLKSSQLSPLFCFSRQTQRRSRGFQLLMRMPSLKRRRRRTRMKTPKLSSSRLPKIQRLNL